MENRTASVGYVIQSGRVVASTNVVGRADAEKAVSMYPNESLVVGFYPGDILRAVSDPLGQDRPLLDLQV
jgi:hypothetical protein